MLQSVITEHEYDALSDQAQRQYTYCGKCCSYYLGKHQCEKEGTKLAKGEVYKTTVELDEDLKEPVMITVIKRKLKGDYSLKQFINDAVREKLDRERGVEA